MLLSDLFVTEDFSGRGAIPALPVNNPKNIDPAALTTGEFLKIVNPGGKMHDDESYQINAEKMARSGYLDYDLFTHPLRRMKVNGINFEVRMREEKGLTVAGEPYTEHTIAVFNEKKPVAREHSLLITMQWSLMMLLWKSHM